MRLSEVTQDRWEDAQSYERGYWESQAREIRRGEREQLEWYRWRAGQLADHLRALDLETFTEGDVDVLEVGSGPVGLIQFFPARVKAAVDPLATFYSGDSALTKLRDGSVQHVEGRGEELPFGGNRFDLVVMENCIDHVQAVGEVMSEVKRVMRSSGLLYSTVNARSPWGYLVHRLLSTVRLDEGHPHTFTRRRFRTLLADHGFRPLSVSADSYFEAVWDDLRSDSWKDKAKALAGVSEVLVTGTARLREGGRDPLHLG